MMGKKERKNNFLPIVSSNFKFFIFMKKLISYLIVR